MTALNQRQSGIIKFLAAENDWVPANRIAESLAISVSTLRRDIEAINEYSFDNESQIISKPGLGLRFDGGSFFSRLSSRAGDQHHEIFATKRLVGIATDLLTQSPLPLSLSALSEKFFVSRSSVVEDLKKVETWLATFSLTLVRDHSGTYINGNDMDIRMALKDIITVSVLSHYQTADSRIDRFSRTKLVDQFGKVNVDNCISLIGLIEDELTCAISEPYYTNLFSHLLVTIRRAAGLAAHALVQTYTRHDCKEWTIAEKAVSWLQEEYRITLPAIEVSYIYQYLISSGRHTLTPCESIQLPLNSEADIYADRLIRESSQDLGLDLSLDRKLHHDLSQHIKPMLNRLAYGIAIHNPLLDEIRSELSSAFHSVKKAAQRINKLYGYADISDDEVAYLTIYLQTALDKFRAAKKIIIVCSSGVGTSQLLSSRINRAFPEWEIIAIVPGSQLSNTLEVKACDLIISTIKLDDVELPVAYVSAIFSKKDIARVSERLFSDENMKEKHHAG
jgi:transcriptional antiterminator